MSYDLIEASAASRRPVELYTFRRDLQSWRYTSADREIVHDSLTYAPAAMSRGAIESTAETARQALRITAPHDLPVLQPFKTSPPSGAVTFTLAEYHEGDGEAAVLWSGRIASVSWSASTATINLEPVYSSIRRAGLRRMFQRQCPHVLYGTACGVNREVHRITGTVDAITGNDISVPIAAVRPDGDLDGGIIEWDDASGIADRRFVLAHAGAALTIGGGAGALAVGQSVRLYPGCDHTPTACDSKFFNIANYGGMPFIPSKNPFGGDPVY